MFRTLLVLLSVSSAFSCDILNYTYTYCNLYPKCAQIYDLAEGSNYLAYAIQIKAANIPPDEICETNPLIWINYMLSTVCEYNQYTVNGTCVCKQGKQCDVNFIHIVSANIFVIILMLVTMFGFLSLNNKQQNGRY